MNKPERADYYQRDGVRVSLPVSVHAVLLDKKSLIAARVEVLSGSIRTGSLLEQWVRARQAAGNLDDVNPVLIEILLELDRKLERLQTPTTSDPSESDAMVVNLSSTGMLFRSPRAYSKDSYLLLAFDLPVFPVSRIELIARVVRSEAQPTEALPTASLTAVEFDTIREDYRDHIIQYVLQKEREQIRAQKAGDSPQGYFEH